MNSLDGNQDKVSPNKALKSILQPELKQETEQTDRQIDRGQGRRRRRKNEDKTTLGATANRLKTKFIFCGMLREGRGAGMDG